MTVIDPDLDLDLELDLDLASTSTASRHHIVALPFLSLVLYTVQQQAPVRC